MVGVGETLILVVAHYCSMETCPCCEKEVVDVKGPYPSAKDGYESFKMYVHKKDRLSPFDEVVDECIEQIK